MTTVWNILPAATRDVAESLTELADWVRGLAPDRRDPERFHDEKSAIAHDLPRLRNRSPTAVAAGDGKSDRRPCGRPGGTGRQAEIHLVRRGSKTYGRPNGDGRGSTARAGAE